ncbi:dihydrodipicolinate synthase family protein [Devosia rhodophyticola]|uniref:Dihydrodipicolinate synthase family protein n=1 Tax=Devosia rhodophyticola TaxID=3026423 RepID=A0ABY7YZM3_9HYPH|nr:dihydrodipicolinate synthase family protein [Devosia rhodophyticola]WDR06706.1 dihydrodipicolinate synthase family protein [Devosia rhodophyticola]
MTISGTYPMLFAFFDEANNLRRDTITRQIDAALSVGSAGIAVLGLGTEVAKLSRGEREQLIDWTINDVGGRVPVAVTISEGNVPDMIASAKAARAAGAAWLILQPPRPPISGSQLVEFFGKVADAVDCPIGIQNAPEFLGVGLTAAELVQLNRQHPNVVVAKAESTALQVGELIDELAGCMKVFNGRAGFELTDNYRAGVDGMIPGVETIDLQVGVEKAMRAGDEAEADRLYRLMLPAVGFAMQGLGQFVLYGKLIAALRLGIEPSSNRLPSNIASRRGIAWAQRYAAELGPLPV